MSVEAIYERLHQLNEIIDDVKDKIGDGVYMEVMDFLKVIYKKFTSDSETDDEEMFTIELGCNCSNNNYSCSSCIEHFNSCMKKYEILEEVPFLAMILNDRFDGQINIPNVKLQMEPIMGEYNRNKVFAIIKFLLNFHDSINGRKNKIINSLCLFHFIFKNFRFVEDEEQFKINVIRKLNEFCNESLEEIDFDKFGFEGNPFNIWVSQLKIE